MLVSCSCQTRGGSCNAGEILVPVKKGGHSDVIVEEEKGMVVSGRMGNGGYLNRLNSGGGKGG